MEMESIEMNLPDAEVNLTNENLTGGNLANEDLTNENLANDEKDLIQELIRQINQIIENSKLRNTERILVIDRFEENLAVCEDRVTR